MKNITQFFTVIALLISANPLFSQNQEFSDSSIQSLWQLAKTSYSQQNFAACLDVLEPLAEDYLGNIEFDRLLGMCAKGANDLATAIFAFERIVTQQPKNAEILMELAIALAENKQREEAIQTFESLLALRPPLETRQFIEQNLSQLRNPEIKFKRKTSLLAAASIGQDSNINSATDLDEFIGFNLSEASQAIGSPLASMRLGFNHSEPVGKSALLSFNTGVSTKHFFDADFVDQDIAYGSLNYKIHKRTHILGLDAQFYTQNVDGSLNSRGTQARLYWNKQLRKNWNFGAYTKLAYLRFGDDLAFKDVDQTALGLTGIFSFGRDRPYYLFADLHTGSDDPQQAGSNYARDFINSRLGLSANISNTLTSTTVVEFRNSDYDLPFFAQAFPDPREDDYYSISSGLRTNFNENWSFSPKIRFDSNASNVDIFAYDRWSLTFELYYLWAIN